MILFLLFLLFPILAYSAPDTTISIPNDFTANTTIVSDEVDENNNEIANKFNTHTHNDITSLGTVTTGTWNAGVLAVTYGGTGQSASRAAFNAIAPGDKMGALIYKSSPDGYTQLVSTGSGFFLASNGVSTQPIYKALPVITATGASALMGATSSLYNSGTEYTAATDIFVYGYTQGSNGDAIITFGYGASSSNDMTLYSTEKAGAGETVRAFLSMMIPKTWKWKFTGNGTNFIQSMPLGN